MRPLLYAGAIAYAIPYATSTSIPLVQRDVPAVLQMAVEHRQFSRASSSNNEAGSTLEASLTNYYFAPILNVTVGTPPQPLSLLVNTGSPYTTLVPQGSPACNYTQACEVLGVYKPHASSTYKNMSSPDTLPPDSSFGISVGSDILNLDNHKFQNFSVQISNNPLAENELGLTTFKSATNSTDSTNFLQTLIDQGLIQSPSFSLWVDDFETNKSSLLFGGVNTAKYHGPLQAVQMVPPDYKQGDSSFMLPPGFLTVQGNSTTYAFTSPVALELSQAFSGFPKELVQILYDSLNITYVDPRKTGFSGWLPCDRKQEDRNISVTSGSGGDNVTLTAAWSDLIQEVIGRDNKTGCILGIQPGSSGGNSSGWIGQPFLRRAYLAVDYANSLVGFAPLNTNPGPDNILEIGNSSSQAGGFPTSNATSTSSASSSTSSSAALAMTEPGVASPHLLAALLSLAFAAL